MVVEGSIFVLMKRGIYLFMVTWKSGVVRRRSSYKNNAQDTYAPSCWIVCRWPGWQRLMSVLLMKRHISRILFVGKRKDRMIRVG